MSDYLLTSEVFVRGFYPIWKINSCLLYSPLPSSFCLLNSLYDCADKQSAMVSDADAASAAAARMWFQFVQLVR